MLLTVLANGSATFHVRGERRKRSRRPLVGATVMALTEQAVSLSRCRYLGTILKMWRNKCASLGARLVSQDHTEQGTLGSILNSVYVMLILNPINRVET